MADRILDSQAFEVDIDRVACQGDSEPQGAGPHLLEAVVVDGPLHWVVEYIHEAAWEPAGQVAGVEGQHVVAEGALLLAVEVGAGGERGHQLLEQSLLDIDSWWVVEEEWLVGGLQ